MASSEVPWGQPRHRRSPVTLRGSKGVMSSPNGVPDLTELLTGVFHARRSMERIRRTAPPHRTDTDLARHQLIKALEAYIAGLTAVNSPVPYRLRDELRLNQSVDAGT